jgi:hypothetical protein
MLKKKSSSPKAPPLPPKLYNAAQRMNAQNRPMPLAPMAIVTNELPAVEEEVLFPVEVKKETEKKKKTGFFNWLKRKTQKRKSSERFNPATIVIKPASIVRTRGSQSSTRSLSPLKSVIGRSLTPPTRRKAAATSRGASRGATSRGASREIPPELIIPGARMTEVGSDSFGGAQRKRTQKSKQFYTF